MIQTIFVTVLLYLIVVATPAMVIGAVQVALLGCLTFILGDMIKMLFEIRKANKVRKAKEANEIKI